MKYVSYSLFGNLKLYCAGALKQLDLLEKYYDGWAPIFYVSENCPVLRDLEKSARVVVMPASEGLVRSDNNIDWHRSSASYNMTWRYHVLDEPDCERAVFKDCDSRPSPRCADAVKRWEDMGTLAMAMYECREHHNGGVMPGMAGLVGGIYDRINHMIYNYYGKRYIHSGEPMIFLDIHAFRDLFINPIAYSFSRFGFGAEYPLNGEMPPECGKFVGDVVMVSDDRNEECE